MNPSLPPPQSPTRWRGRLALLLGAVVLLLLATWIFRPRSSEVATSFHEVRRGSFTVSVIEGGNLSAVSEISVRSEVEGVARIIFIVPEGSYVMEGDLLVELDSAQAQDQVNQQQIAYERARFGVIQAEQTLEIQRSTTNSDIRAAALKLQFAKLDLQKFEQGQRVVDLIEASNRLVAAQAQLTVNLETYLNTRDLAAKGYETKLREDGDRLTVLNNTNSLIVASNTLWMLRTFDHPKLFAQFQSDVRETESELERVVAQSIRRIAQYEADLITQSNTLALNSRKLERDKKNLDACRIYAPQDGLVVYASGENRWSSESLIEEGATVRNRQEIIKLPDTSRMKVTVKVHESHVNMIRPGLPAFVILDSMPDERFAGVVDRVGLLPDTQSRWGNPNLKVYNTDIHITDKLPDVKPGVSAKAEIIITNIDNALSIPIQAVTTLKGKQVAYRARGNTSSEPQPVETGLYNTKYVQILDGLQEGDRVLLAPPFDSQSKDLTGEILAPEEKAKIKFTNTVSTPANPRLNRDEVLKRYDRDQDGKLNDQERAAMERAFGDRMPGLDRPGNGNNRPNGNNGRTPAPNAEPRERPNRRGTDGEGPRNAERPNRTPSP